MFNTVNVKDEKGRTLDTLVDLRSHSAKVIEAVIFEPRETYVPLLLQLQHLLNKCNESVGVDYETS